jgi:hypothetical protein
MNGPFVVKIRNPVGVARGPQGLTEPVDRRITAVSVLAFSGEASSARYWFSCVQPDHSVQSATMKGNTHVRDS